jgi:hypothetical protein
MVLYPQISPNGQVHEVNSEQDPNLVDIVGDENARLANCSSAIATNAKTNYCYNVVQSIYEKT